MKSHCSKAGCRSEDGTIPTMNVPLKAVQPKAKRCRRALLDVVEDVSSEESEPEDEEEFLGIIEDTDEEIEFASEKVNEEENRDAMEESDEYEMGEASGHSFKKIAISNVITGQWVIVNYIGKYFIGKVIPVGIEGKGKQKKKFVRVQCLSEPYGVHLPQDLEPEDVAADYPEVFECDVPPQLQKTGRGKWQWCY